MNDRELLIASGYLFDLDDDVTGLVINMNDTWSWASAGAEEIPDECVPEVARLFRNWGWPGMLYWVSKRSNWMRSEFKDINRWIDFVRREEEWIAKEPSSSKRAYTDIPEVEDE